MPALGDVLRGLGSVLNPQVMQAAEQEEAQKRQQMNQLGMLLVNKQIEQQSPEAKAKLAALARAEEARTRMAAATTPEERRAIAMEYASPDAVVRAGQQRPTVVAPGATVLGPDNQPVFSAPAAPQRPTIVAPGATVLGPDNQPVFTAPEKAEKPGYKEREVSYDGKTYTKEFSNDNGQSWAPIAGAKPVDIRAARGGTNIINNNGMPLGKEASNKIDAGLLDTTSGVMKLSAIESAFKPEYQTIAPRISAGWSSVKEKLGADLSSQDRAFLSEFSAYKRNAINVMNEYIKSITGAAMSEAEATRILQGMPKVGEGLFDGDSPTEFKAKLDDAMKQTKLSLARYEYIKRNGMAMTKADGSPVIGLDRMPQIMNDRAKVLESELRKMAPQATKGQLEDRVRQLLAKEFGLVK